MPLALLAAAYVALVAIATLRPGPLSWGLHHLAFVPASARILVFALLGAGVVLVAAGAWRGRAEGGAGPGWEIPGNDRARGWAAARWVALPLVIAGPAIFWILRTRSFLLGDQALWIDRLVHGTKVAYSEPLSAWTWLGFRKLLLTAGAPLEPSAFALLPAALGALAILLCLAIGRELLSQGGAGWAAALLLLSGTSQLYFGYIEAYALVSVSVLLYVWLGLRYLRGKDSILGPATGFALAVSSHLIALYLAPSYLLLVFRRPMRGLGRIAAIALPTALVATIFALLAFGSEQALRPARWVLSALQVAAGQRPGGASAPLPALRVALDVGNLLLLVAPVPLMLIVGALVSRRGPARQGAPERDWDVRFLGVAALAGLLVVCTLCVPGTPAQDWDLLSICALPLAPLGLALGRRFLERTAGGAVRGGLTLLSAAGLLSFVLVNADSNAAVKRFEVLMSEAAPLAPHERAYGSEKLGDHFASAGDQEKSLVFAMRSLAADSANGRYWGKVGEALYRMGRYAEAIPHFETAAARGGSRGAAFYFIAFCHMHTARPDLALPYLWKAVREEPDRPSYWGALGSALIATGDIARGREIWERVLARWPGDRGTAEAYRMVFGSLPGERPGSPAP